MNMLDDDRKKYSMGSSRKGYMMGGEGNDKKFTDAEKGLMGMGISAAGISTLKTKPMDSSEVRDIIVRVEKETSAEPGTLFNAIMSIRPTKKSKKETPRMQKQYGGSSKKRMNYVEGGSLLDEDMTPMTIMPSGTDMSIEPPMDSDETMEKEYSNFIITEALSEEEEDMLMSKLEQDEELQMLFDKVVDVAQEFAGEGPVEGPGSGVSDSIPARLSDGEFVFTAKAVEEIGEDVLMSMMKEAEDAAGEREGFAMGGVYDEEEIEDEESDVSNDMRKVNPRLNPNSR